MTITTKAAAIAKAPSPDEAGPGTWTAVLSAQTKDRDGDVLAQDGWKLPLPARIPIDIDHEMSVRGTIGSAVPSFNDDGDLVVEGTFASTPLAQEVRVLMAEGHIDRMSVAFMVDGDGEGPQVRELLNGAVVCIPSNREAVITEVRNYAGLKEGRRNSMKDAAHVQAIHDSAASLGASCGDTEKSFGAGAGVKSFDGTPAPGSFEQRIALVHGEIWETFAPEGSEFVIVATFEGRVVFEITDVQDPEVGGALPVGRYSVGYTVDGEEVTFTGEPEKVTDEPENDAEEQETSTLSSNSDTAKALSDSDDNAAADDISLRVRGLSMMALAFADEKEHD